MTVTNVVKTLEQGVSSKDLNEHIQERNPMNVTNVVKPLQEGVTSKDKRSYRRESL